MIPCVDIIRRSVMLTSREPDLMSAHNAPSANNAPTAKTIFRIFSPGGGMERAILRDLSSSCNISNGISRTDEIIYTATSPYIIARISKPGCTIFRSYKSISPGCKTRSTYRIENRCSFCSVTLLSSRLLMRFRCSRIVGIGVLLGGRKIRAWGG
jgi:hypothetical protein